MIARLFPLKINFPTRLTVPWPNYVDDVMKDAFMPTIKSLLFDEPVLVRYLRDRTFG